MIEAHAFGKVTLSLRVAPPTAAGLHPVDGLFQSIDWCDELSLATDEADLAVTSSGEEVIDGMRNLAWEAVDAVRRRAVSRPPLALTLDKNLPVAAGLGGGSADAAAALALAGRLLGVDRADLTAAAPTLGSDVPFCFVGGTARVHGTGELIDERPPLAGFALGIVVPPIEVATAHVYRRWDDLEGPSGRPLDPVALPPELRAEPLVNDLLPAAVAVAPEIAEWRSELRRHWGRPVALAGSGPSLFAFFLDRDEALAAVGTAPAGARAAAAAVPVDYGWTMQHTSGDGAVDSRGRAVSTW